MKMAWFLSFRCQTSFTDKQKYVHNTDASILNDVAVHSFVLIRQNIARIKFEHTSNLFDFFSPPATASKRYVKETSFKAVVEGFLKKEKYIDYF